MSLKVSELESVLCDCYKAEATHYKQALDLIERLPSAFERAQGTEGALQELRAILDTIAAIDAEAEETKVRWIKLNQLPGPLLREQLDLLQKLLERMVQKIHIAEQLAQQSRDRLIPQLDSVSRGHRMQNAYKAVANQG